jgi:hypothetical protein
MKNLHVPVPLVAVTTVGRIQAENVKPVPKQLVAVKLLTVKNETLAVLACVKLYWLNERQNTPAGN